MAQIAELSLTMSLALGGNGTDVVKANAVRFPFPPLDLRKRSKRANLCVSDC
jgi:hypothetical protein